MRSPENGAAPVIDRGTVGERLGRCSPRQSITAHASNYLARGLQPIPIPYQQKRPVLDGWQALRLSPEDVPQYFGAGAAQNIGVLLGEPSDGVVVVDLDCPEALAVAISLLPPTDVRDGREDIPLSHAWYLAEGDTLKTVRFDDPIRAKSGSEKARLLELLGTGAQVLVFPSVHPTGVRYRPLPDGQFPRIPYHDLRFAVACTAGAALLARYWPGRGTRHTAALALAGYLLNAGVSETAVEQIISAAAQAAGDEEVDDRVRAVGTTAARRAAGEPVVGGPTLADYFDTRIIDALKAWLFPAIHVGGAVGDRGRVSSDNSQAPVPPFPVASLPPTAQRFVTEGAASLRCPSDLVGVPFLAMVAGVIGNRHQVELKPSYRQRAILWTATIAEPGTAKSPAQGVGQSCLDALQREAHALRQEAVQEYERQLDAWKGKDKQSRDRNRERDRDEDRGERPEPPADEQHFYSTDSTTEAVAKMLGGERSVTPGFVIIRDELVGWVLSFDAYRASRGGDRQTWLSMWAGMPFKSDRAGRDSIYVPEPAVSVCGGIQPDMLPSLAAESGQRDGFIERFLFSYPDTTPMRWTDAYVRRDTREAMTIALRALRQATAGTIYLEPMARRLYTVWVDENADLQDGVSGIIRGYYAKLPSQLARLALILHCLELPEAPVSEPLSAQTMASAISLIEYFRAHAHRAFTHFGAAARVSHPLATRVLQNMREGGGGWLRTSALYEQLGGHIKADALQTALAELQRARLAECRDVPTETTGGRPAKEWRLRELTELTEESAEDEVLAGVNSHSSDTSQEHSPRMCRFCAAPLSVGSDACFECGDRPCVLCFESTGSAVRDYCFVCAARTGRRSA